MPETKRPGLTITEEPGGYLHKLLIGCDGEVLLDETVLPHDDLIRFTQRPLKDYRQQLTKLERHPLFKESFDVSVLDFKDFITQSYALADTFRADFPEAYFFTRAMLEDVMRTEDDGSAGILLQAGMRMLQAVRELYSTRVRMRNILEVCFGTTEGMAQGERWERTAAIYPQLYAHAFSVRWKPDEDTWVREYEMRSLLELYFFEVCAVFRSSKRISRCQCCWRYFVPKTKKKTDYCDRVWSDGSTCKQRGPNLKRKDGPSEDLYLLAFKKLRARFYEREHRDYTNGQGMAVPYGDYNDWMEEASAARVAYLEGEIDGDEFLRRINPENEKLDLQSSHQTVAEDILFTPWEQLVEGNISFDPNRYFQGMQFIDLGIEGAQWKNITAQDQIQASKHGNISLLERYKRQK